MLMMISRTLIRLIAFFPLVVNTVYAKTNNQLVEKVLTQFHKNRVTIGEVETFYFRSYKLQYKNDEIQIQNDVLFKQFEALQEISEEYCESEYNKTDFHLSNLPVSVHRIDDLDFYTVIFFVSKINFQYSCQHKN
jgi:hypothetical protein